MNDLVTIYITSIDRELLLERAVNSVLTQTYSNIELIIIDDGSKKFSPIDVFKKNKWDQDKRIKLFVNEENKGACYSRNIAIKVASGKFITGLDDDDYFHPLRIELLLKAYNSGNYSAVNSLYSFSPESETSLTLPLKYKIKENLTLPQIVSIHDLKVYNKLNNNVLTETYKLREIGGFDENFKALQDYDTWFRLLEKFGPALIVPKVLYFHYIHNSSITATHGKSLIGHKAFIEKHKEALTSSGLQNFEILMEQKKKSKVSVMTILKNLNSSNLGRCFYLLIKGKVTFIN